MDISEEERLREAFEEKGYVKVDDLLPDQTLTKVERTIDDILDRFARADESRDDVLRRLAKEDGRERSKSYEVSQLFRQIPAFHALESEFEKVFNVLYPDHDSCLTVLLDTLVGYPEDEEFLNWHQEAAYMGEKEILNLWFPLFRDATPENGSMRMLEASHKHGTFPTDVDTHFPEYGKAVYNRTPTNIDDLVAEHREVRSNVEHGGVVALHSDLVHMSGNIQTDSVRITGIVKMGPVRDDLPTEYPNILAVSPQRD